MGLAELISKIRQVAQDFNDFFNLQFYETVKPHYNPRDILSRDPDAYNRGHFSFEGKLRPGEIIRVKYHRVEYKAEGNISEFYRKGLETN